MPWLAAAWPGLCGGALSLTDLHQGLCQTGTQTWTGFSAAIDRLVD